MCAFLRTLYYNGKSANYQAPRAGTFNSFRHKMGKEGARAVKLYVADGEAGLMIGEGEKWRRAGPAGEAVCAFRGCIFCAGQGMGACYRGATGERIFDLSLPTGVCALCPLGGNICALSQDADCICAFCPFTGEMRYSAPAGVYPRDLCQSPCGRFLAAAGGMAGEILLMDEGLRCVKKYRVPGAACAVAFLPRGMLALCAVGEGELSSRLMKISPRGVMEEMHSFPDPPCCLCPLPGGRCLVGCHNQVICLRADGKITHRMAFPCPVRIRQLRGKLAICDICRGEIADGQGRILYRGGAPEDAAEAGMP